MEQTHIEWPTAAVVAIAVLAIVLLALFGNDTIRAAIVPAVGILGTIAAAQMRKLRTRAKRPAPDPSSNAGRSPKPPSLVPVVIIGVLELATGTMTEACGASPAAIARATDTLVDKACEGVTAVTDDGTAKTICATATELADMGALIAEMRESDPPQLSSPAAGARRAPAACRPLPRTPVCATNTERLAAIDAVLARRSLP